jgi:hypothetical protein
MKRAVVLLAVLGATGMISSGAGAETPRAPFTLYSDACLHRESGDVLGTRIGFLNIRGGLYVFYQAA